MPRTPTAPTLAYIANRSVSGCPTGNALAATPTGDTQRSVCTTVGALDISEFETHGNPLSSHIDASSTLGVPPDLITTTRFSFVVDVRSEEHTSELQSLRHL